MPELGQVNRDEILDLLKESLKDKRFQHVLRVEQTGLDLARHYGESEEKTSLACLLHDLKKEEDDRSSRQTIISYNLPLDLLDYGNAIWHGPVAAVYAEKNLEIEDRDVLNAISNHTVGSENMSLLEKIVFIADYIEPGRDFPGVEEARELAYQDLDRAVGFATQKTLHHLIESNKRVFPKTVLTYNRYSILD